MTFPEVPVTDPSSSTTTTWNSSFLELLSEAYSVVDGLGAIDFQNTFRTNCVAGS